MNRLVTNFTYLTLTILTSLLTLFLLHFVQAVIPGAYHDVMTSQRQPEKTVQEEIKREDRDFLAGGVVFMIGGIILLLLIAFLLLRFLVLPLFSSLLSTFRSDSTDIPINTTPPPPEQNTPVLKNIDAVPYDWVQNEIHEVGIAISHPNDATISAKGNVAELAFHNLSLQFAQKSLTENDLEDEVQDIRNSLNDGSDSTLVEKTEVAGIDGYSFVVDSSNEQRIYLLQEKTRYLEIIIPDLKDNDELRSVVDDVLASIEPIADNSPVEDSP